MRCRRGCAACCIAPSISSPIPGMPRGKPAGVRCIQLTNDDRCKLWGLPERPLVCGGFAPALDSCGASREQAFAILTRWERLTQPTRAS
jgi:Fe-S-cluster containining protein